jgi:hypothetical protein
VAQNIDGLKETIVALHVFLAHALIPRITSSVHFEIMRDVPEMIDCVRKLKSYSLFLTDVQKNKLNGIVETLQNQINILLDEFRSAIGNRDKNSTHFESVNSFERINAQHARLVLEFEVGVEAFLISLRDSPAMPSVRVGLTGPQIDIVEWWKFLRKGR